MVERFAYATISVAGTVNIATQSAFLHSLNITDTTAGTLTIKNGTAAASGTVGLHLGGAVDSFIYDVVCGSGISVVTAGNIKANVSYAII
jgi:hypothetical protein